MPMSPPQRSPDLISVIVPTLDEEKNIVSLLEDLQRGRQVEVIVVDGGSRDRTIARAQEMGVRVITTPAGRARQMNHGAAVARGRLLFFVHADSRLSFGFADMARQALDVPGVAAAAFRLRIDAPGTGLRFVEFWANLRSRVLQMPYGDQGLFIAAGLFRKVGGFPSLPIMEDFELVRRLRCRGRIVILPAAVRTSPRRWMNVGVGRTTLINQTIVLAYLAGFSPNKLARWYRRSRGIG